jgi:hypothetical protein
METPGPHRFHIISSLEGSKEARVWGLAKLAGVRNCLVKNSALGRAVVVKSRW